MRPGAAAGSSGPDRGSMARTLWRAAFAAAVVVQFVVLYAPRAPSVASGLPIDKVVHFAVFFAVAALGVRVGVPLRWLTGLLVLQAIGSEVLQGVVLPGRSADPWDVVADVAGIAVGVAAGLGRGRPGAAAPGADG